MDRPAWIVTADVRTWDAAVPTPVQAGSRIEGPIEREPSACLDIVAAPRVARRLQT